MPDSESVGELREQAAGHSTSFTAHDQIRGPASESFIANSAGHSTSLGQRERDGLVSILPADYRNSRTAAPTLAPQGSQIKHRTWDPARDSITFAIRAEARLHGHEGVPATTPNLKPISTESEDESSRPMPTALPPNGPANSSLETNSTNSSEHTAYDRLQLMSILLGSIRATLWNLIASLRELETHVAQRIGWSSAHITLNQKDDDAAASRDSANEQSTVTASLGSRATPELKITDIAAVNVEDVGEVHSKPADDLRFKPRPSGFYPEINGCFIPNPSKSPPKEVCPGSQTSITVSAQPCQLPYVPFTYKIQLDLQQQALSASPSSDAAYWHYDLYRGAQGQKVKVHYCCDLETTERTAKLFAEHPVLGLDLEWKPQATAREGFKSNVSLIQLACEEHIALFHISIFPKYGTKDSLVGPTLKKIIESPEITKVGVAIKADSARLHKYLGIQPRGLFELSHLHKLVKVSSEGIGKVDRRLVSLAEQVKEHLGMPLSKGDVRYSNWSKPLGKLQVHYAASDAYAASHLYDVLEKKRLALNPTPPRPAHAELNLPIRLAEGVVIPATDEEPVAVRYESVEATEPPPPAETLAESSKSAVAISVSKLVPTHPYVVLAGAWVSQYRSGLKPPEIVRASTPQLRAYALWHLHQQDVQEIAKLLRDPPLQRSTVASYVLEAVRLQKLAYDLERLRVVHTCLPLSLRGKYQSIFNYKATARIVGA